MSSPVKTVFRSQGFCFEAITGLERGSQIELSGERLTLGRSNENDIVLVGEGVSRDHAHLVFSDGGWFIRDNGSKNGLIVNGRKVDQSWLESGDLVQIGAVQLRFHAPSLGPETQPGPVQPLAFPGVSAHRRPSRRVIIYGSLGVLLVAALLLSSNPETKTVSSATDSSKLARDFDPGEEPGLGVNDKQQQLSGMEDPVLKQAEQQMASLDWTNKTLRESEQFFRRGQREYLSKNYHRAIDAFQTALALFNGHVLAERYLRRVIYEAEIEAKRNMEIGVHYFNALQYQRAIYHFRQVVSLMSHRADEKIVLDAKKYIEQSQKRLQAAELFP